MLFAHDARYVELALDPDANAFKGSRLIDKEEPKSMPRKFMRASPRRPELNAPDSNERNVTARQVAALAGVSISAVSRTFTEGASVSAATRSRVLAATRSLGYRPNLLARSLMTKRTELIGLISNNFDNPAFIEMFDLFTRRLHQRGLRPLLANLSGGARPDAALDMLLQYRVDGVIVASSTLPTQFSEACVEARLPVVLAFGTGCGRYGRHWCHRLQRHGHGGLARL